MVHFILFVCVVAMDVKLTGKEFIRTGPHIEDMASAQLRYRLSCS